MAEVVFCTESYRSPTTQLSAMRAVNCFIEMEPKGAKSQSPLFGAPGLTQWCTLPVGPVRGLWNWNGVLYAVAGQRLFQINSAGGYKTVSYGQGEGLAGNPIGGTGRVSMSDNGQQLCIVNGQAGWILNNEIVNTSPGLSGVFTQIVDPNFNSARTVLYFDGYFVFDRAETNQFFISPLNTGLPPYDGLAFASAVAKPGFLLATKENLQLLFLFCQNHIEMWYDAGTPDFPFQRYAGGVIERGCVSSQAIVNQDDAIFFLGTDRIFYRLQGNTAIRISTHAIENEWSTYGDISDAHCFTYTISGHKHVVVTFPSKPATWVFDISTRLWHERESWDANDNSLGRWRANCAVEIYDKVLIGDAFTGDISILTWNQPTELGNTVRWLAHSTTISNDRMPMFINRLEMDMQVGFGASSGQDSKPGVLLRVSKDGGMTWSRYQTFRSLGQIGKYAQRLRWLSMGRAYQWTFELLITSDVPRTLISTHLDAEMGM